MTTSYAGTQHAPHERRSLGVGRILLLASLVYIVCVGGTGGGELNPALRLLTGLIGASVVLACIIFPIRQPDRVDRLVVVATVLFALAGMVSLFPRQALDATLTATAYAAAFLLARGVLDQPAARTMLERVLMGLSAFFTLAAAATWVPDIIQLWALSDWQVFPPLDLPLASGGWGYRYDVALLIAILYPAWWSGRPSRLRWAFAIPFGMLALGAIIITGSRALWLATAVASLVVGAPLVVRLWRQHRWARVTVGASLIVVAIGALVLAEPLMDRALTVTSLEYRVRMWGPLTELWLANPVAGVGPGSFPWALQLTPYFETDSWAPRSPDNVLFQLLPEAGLLGLAALALIVAAVGPAVWKGRSGGARWALVTCAVVSIGSNPTEWPFLVVLILAWAAYAAPRQRADDGVPPRGRWRGPVLVSSVAALGLICAAQSSIWFGMLAYENARMSAERGDFRASIDDLTTAIALDPGMGLYWRQRGVGWLFVDEAGRAVADLEATTDINPSDDLAWRVRAMAHAANGETAAAIQAIEAALRIQRSDAANLLIAASLYSETGEHETAASMLAELVQAWPMVVGAPGWSELDVSVSTQELVDAAQARWAAEKPSLVPALHQDLWLAALTGSPSTPSTSQTSPELADAVMSSLRCESDASILLAQTRVSDRRTGLYWMTRLRDASNRGTVDERAEEALRIYFGDAPMQPPDRYLNPLNDGEWWGYRRFPIFWPPSGMDLPDIGAGQSRWLYHPSEAAAEAGLQDRLPACASAGR